MKDKTLKELVRRYAGAYEVNKNCTSGLKSKCKCYRDVKQAEKELYEKVQELWKDIVILIDPVPMSCECDDCTAYKPYITKIKKFLGVK